MCSLNVMYSLCSRIWFAMNFIMVFGICLFISLLVSLCMFTVSKALLIMSRATVIVHARDVICLNLLAVVLLILCSTMILQ